MHWLRQIFQQPISTTWQQVPATDRKLFVLLLAVHFLLSGWFITRLDFTSDESAYFGYAIRWAHGQQERIVSVDDSKSPIVFPAIIPSVFKPWMNLENDPYGFRVLAIGRWFMYGYLLLGAVIFFCWMYRLLGSRKWLMPMLLLLFDPVVFSYGMIVGSDIASMSLLLGIAYTAWRFSQTNEMRYWWWLAVFTGLAMLAKASMLYVFPLLLAMMATARWQQPATQRTSLRSVALRWMLLAGVALLIVNLGYGFQRSGFLFEELPQRSEAFQQLVQRFSFLHGFRIPLPYHFVDGFDLLKHNAALGGGTAEENSFVGVEVLGRHFDRGPVWYYYLVAFLFKLPLLTLCLLGMAVLLFLRRPLKFQFLTKHVFIWMPAVYFFVMLSLTNPFQIGIRHALMLFPFLYMAVAFAWVQVMPKQGKLVRWLLVFHLASLVSFWPNMLAYTNELLWPKRKVYHYLNDSSIAYGNSKIYVKYFLKKHPEYQYPGKSPAAGKYAVDMESLTDYYNRFGLAWLCKNFEPVDHYMHTVFLFEVSEQQLKARGLRNK